MIQRILNSKNFVACLLAAATGMVLYIKMPFPEGNLFFELMFLWARPVFLGFKYSYIVFLYTTPYIGYSVLLSGLYIFALKIPQRIRPGRLPAYPDPRKRPDLSLVLGEVHNPRKPVPAAAPHWLVVPERGLFTGIAIFGAVGTGKTSCCMYPFAEQIFAYCAGDKEKRIGGLVLEVKGDFCHRIKEILARHGREDDYIEISLDSAIPLQPASQRPRRLCPGLQHRVAPEQSLREGQGTLLAAGVHKPRQIHHPSAQDCLRLRNPVRCL